MRAIEIKTIEGAGQLIIANRPLPPLNQGEALIKVAYAGVNRPDVLQRRGFYPPPAGVTDIPGLEVAGIIRKLGDGVDPAWLGQRVMALVPGGGYAEFVAAPANQILTLPEGLSFEDAAAIPETLYTVWANVFEAAQIKSGEILFVHGATSGIGTMAVSLAIALDIGIYGSAGSPEKTAAAEALGYTKVFNYRRDDWAKQMAALGGADVVLDMVGGDYVAKNLSLLRPKGRHISIAVQGGMLAEVNLLDMMKRALVMTGSTMRARDPAEKARLTRTICQHVMPLIAAGKVRPKIAQAFPLEQANLAHELMESGDLIGKIILRL